MESFAPLQLIRPRDGIWRRIAAWSSRYAAPYEHALAARKRALFAELRGRVVEIGPGAGANLAYLHPRVGRPLEWIGVEPSGPMQAELHARAHSLGSSVQVLTGTAESLPFDDASVDAVVGTLVLCSVGDVERALGEIRRVLRPGGRYSFIEHVAAPLGSALRCKQELASPIWSLIGDGCRLTRDNARAIEREGFAAVHIDTFEVAAGLMSPHIAGFATR